MSLFNIGFIIFLDLTQLDFTGPLQVLSRLPQSATHIVAKSEAPVPSDCGLGLVPTHTFANCPSLGLLCVPGGSYGVVRAIGDRETINSSADRRVLQSISPRFAPEHSFWVLPEYSKDDGQQPIGPLQICCLSLGPRTSGSGLLEMAT